MRLVLKWVVVMGLLAAAVGAGLAHLNRQWLERHWASYRVGTAADLDEARDRIGWFETGPDAPERLQDLVRRWGTGNQRFDYWLAWYVHDPKSSERFREAFSLELAKREGLLARWAHFWLWRTTEEPDRQVRQDVSYLGNIAAAEAATMLTWREVLDLQAIFHQTGQNDLAERLTPTNWRDRYLRWSQAQSGPPGHAARPVAPFADWSGPIPAKRQ